MLHGKSYVGIYRHILLLVSFVHFYNSLFKKPVDVTLLEDRNEDLLWGIAETIQDGPDPLFCFRHFKGWFSAHGNMALNGSGAQIQDNISIVSSSKSQTAGSLRLCGAQ